MAKPVSDEHALLCGMVWGMAMRHGLPMNPVVDEHDDGTYDYSDTYELELPAEYGGPDSPTRVFLVVQPPEPTHDADRTLSDLVNRRTM